MPVELTMANVPKLETIRSRTIFGLSVVQVLFEEGCADLRHLAAFSDGLPLLREAAARFPPERVAERTGISAPAIRELARAFAAAPSAVAYGRVGASTQAIRIGGESLAVCSL